VDCQARQREVLKRVLKLRPRAVASLARHAVPVWVFLDQRFRSTPDIQSDFLFQFLFRSYYRLDNAGLDDPFKDAYFKLLQSHREERPPDLRRICQELADTSTEKGTKTLHFSFATKLAGTIAPEQPIYDSFVAYLFRFRRPDHLKDPDKRLNKLLEFYECLRDTSRWLPQQKGFDKVDAAFARGNPGWEDVPPMKRVDLILWATGKAAKKYDCMGFPVSAALRWMGRAGWTFAEAKKALAKFCPACKENTIRTYLGAGARRERGEPAGLTDAQVKRLEAAAGKGQKP
jgi:hypothetical protein